jgi:pimeloyl-ACP methyl ester carboxylesterase
LCGRRRAGGAEEDEIQVHDAILGGALFRLAPVTELNVVEWGDAGDVVVCVHGSLGWGEDTFPDQRPLADEFRLRLVDRRGFGATPVAGRVDFDRDADDVASLLDDPAHLLGQSYGGVVSLLAAARRPDAVRSLTVIEPPAFALAMDDAVVADLVRGIRAASDNCSDPAEYRLRFLRAFGFDPSEEPLEGADLEAARSSMTERTPDEAQIPLDQLAAAPFPKLVVRGAWDIAPQQARERAGHAFGAVCDVLERRLRAESVTFAGAAHNPQFLGAPFNERLAAFWRSAG